MSKATRWLAILDLMERKGVCPRVLHADIGGASLRTFQRDLAELRALERVTVDDGWWTLEGRCNGADDS